jgi:hypothetical protein
VSLGIGKIVSSREETRLPFLTTFRGSRYDRRWLGGQAIPQVDSASVTRSAESAPTSSAIRTSSGSGGAAAQSGPSRASKPNGGVEQGRDAHGAYDWERLERAVRALVERQESLDGQVSDLRARLAERDERVRGLESQVLDANQRRQDTAKRIDELIAQLDQLEAQLDNAEPGE